MYRSDVDIFKLCASEQKMLNCSLLKEHLIYTDNSIKNYIRKYEADEVFLSEALIKTYPTVKLSKHLVKLLANEFKSLCDKCMFTLDLDDSNASKEKLLYDTDEKAIYEYPNDKFNDVNMYFYCSGEYVEGNIAGNVVYVLTINHPDAPSKFSTSLIEKLIDAGQKYGYDYVACARKKLDFGIQYQIMYEAKYQVNDIEISDKLYHVAPYSLKDKILKYGLSPKSNSVNNGEKLNHSDRVYLYNDYDENRIVNFLNASGKTSTRFNKMFNIVQSEKVFSLFEIDRTKLSHISFFRDNMYSMKDIKVPVAVYTYDNIPPKAIKHIKEIDLT